jgi:hypothetical protein
VLSVRRGHGVGVADDLAPDVPLPPLTLSLSQPSPRSGGVVDVPSLSRGGIAPAPSAPTRASPGGPRDRPDGSQAAIPRTPKRVFRRLAPNKVAELVRGYVDGRRVDVHAQHHRDLVSILNLASIANKSARGMTMD